MIDNKHYTLQGLKDLRLGNIKTNKVFADALVGVIASLETQRGRTGIDPTKAEVLAAIRKEIKIYNESQSHDLDYLRVCQAKALELETLNITYMTDQSLTDFYTTYKELNLPNNPKAFMGWLDVDANQEFAYDKGKASKLVLGKPL